MLLMDHYPNRVIILQFAIFDISEATEICFIFFKPIVSQFSFPALDSRNPIWQWWQEI